MVLKDIFSVRVDTTTRFAFAYAYKSLTSRNARDFLEKLIKIMPFKVKRVQTDNGSEFMGEFEELLNKLNIIHFFNYPKDPQSNAFVERFNRTLYEHLIEWNLNEIIQPDKFNYYLMNYLLWYNTQKPHQALSAFSPLEYFLKNYIRNNYYSNMYINRTILNL